MVKCGEVTVKGLAYEDIVSILANNGYATEVFTPCIENKPIMEWEHVIRIYRGSEEK